ncbi:glucosamine--fructose-6-phosphate aminotransferase (isomerizing) [Meinhardsimonia xiamenensis]|jgi:glucosamine--fructose-6-phosphate aminotransferase (isomerizing)|uniref:Glutamine--fructose-6-phosphate aminotransferase [isomerizing] n=1 Tax=Meinhardsimonia xiamenensis TaxID=990712 RepID=A0A1G9F9W6_9RHOB|nr:glutamine--fructose-6-phosphate transaminase (isomerizing) [Meinhardsimonia xiamenensis]PRX37929.1 glucosamine--fructose-6-phosphate aminotransferase (isomerizing) [Meinhardsimonia xiamenensis]SDK85212.1 glucosamine--fructose-6-phosphate aminotransferase (isomerizing) [Meinhardsimonia xiamenensis]
MCGIVGVLGRHEAAPIIVEALKRLEYRGYDSAGIATVDASGRLDRRRAVGKLVNLSDRLVHEPLTGTSGIGHTRWATHGAATETNAHPHQAGRVAVVHNGIIENFKELRAALEAKGYAFGTETDTETVAVLCESFLDQGLAPRDAAEQTIARLEGAFALAFLFEGEPDLMIVARRGSPLAIGHGDGEVFVGSDAIALGPLTRELTYLEEGDWAVLTRHSVEIYDAEGRRANRPVRVVEIDAARVEKGGYRHFMMKEIAEQPTVLGNVIRHYLTEDGRGLALPEATPDFARVDRLSLVACGTAFYACMVAKYWFEQLAGLPVDVDIASEFRYREPPITAGTAALFVSQSGETADTLAALRFCQGRAEHILSVVNVPESSIARESDLALPILAGPEIGVASTKAFTCQLAVLACLALQAALDRGRIDEGELAGHLRALASLPGLVARALDLDGRIAALAERLAEARDVLYLGRGAIYPIALEGALKLKEISYIHAEGYAAGELKHGPIALIDKSVPVVVLAPRDGLFPKTVSNMQEVMARHGQVLLVSDQRGIDEAAEGSWAQLAMPAVEPLLAPILYAVPVQLLAYHTAVAKGTDVDQPRNLAKSVTVE